MEIKDLPQHTEKMAEQCLSAVMAQVKCHHALVFPMFVVDHPHYKNHQLMVGNGYSNIPGQWMAQAATMLRKIAYDLEREAVRNGYLNNVGPMLGEEIS